MGCVFCKIFTDQTEEVLCESTHSFCILSNPRLVPGHLLIVPKKHVERFSELTEEERKDLFDEAVRLEEMILHRFATGCDFSQHYRPFLPESKLKINHLHIHLKPREFEDDLFHKVQKYEKDVFQDLQPEECSAIKSRLFDSEK